MKPLAPILTSELFPELRGHLLSLLADLAPDDWLVPTAAGQWNVKDVALHLLGGMAALTYLISRIAASHVSFRWTLFEGTTIYWHFMGGLWLYLLVVIAARL